MTTLNESRDLIISHFISEWGSETEYAMDNIEFTPPDNDSWAELYVRPNFGSQVSLGEVGNRRHRNWGIISVNIYVPLNTATYAGDVLVQKAMDLWREANLSGVHIYNVSPHIIGSTERQGKQYYQYSVTAEFEYDEIV